VAGYSTRSLPDKLGIKPGMGLAVLGAPAHLIAELAGSTTLETRLRPGLDMVMFFTMKRRELERRWPALTRSLTPAGALWVSWPKKSAVKAQGLVSDMTEDVVREVALPTGWVDTKVCAVDDTWSGLKCVLRVELRG
jgi:hypothetical protein